jgi:hypothetical protein
VSLAYTKSKLSDVYPSLSDDVYDEVFHITTLPQLWMVAPRFDVVHCHNEPDALSVAALAGGVPVVHDTHDLISLRHAGDSGLAFMEAVANRGAQGRVYCTPYLRAEAEKLYAPKGPSITLCNYASLGDVPETLLPKLSATDGETHAVYEGGVGGTDHRDFGEFFCNLAAAGVHVHVYPTFNAAQLRDIFARHHRVHIHETASPKDIIREMSQYDFGLIPFNVAKGNQRFLDTAMPNKLFEYLAAGLPVATSKLHSFEDWFSTHPVGVTFESVNHLLAQLPKLRELAGEVDFSRQVFTYEQQIDELVGLYRKLIAEARQPGGEPVSISTPQPSGPRGDKPHKTAVFISGPPRYVTYLVDQLDEVLAEVDCDYFFHMWKDDLGNKVRNEQCEGWQELWRHPRTKVFLLQAPYAEGDFERRSWRASGRVAACGMPASSINATVGMFSSVHTLCNALESLPDFEDYTHVMRLRTDTLILADDFASKLSPDPTVITAAASNRIAPGRLCDHFMFAPVDLFFACWKHDAETVYRVYESVNYSPEQTLAQLQKRYASSATLQHAIKRFEDYHIVYNPTRSDDPAWINRIIETCGVQDLYENLDKHLGRQRPTRAAS